MGTRGYGIELWSEPAPSFQPRFSPLLAWVLSVCPGGGNLGVSPGTSSCGPNSSTPHPSTSSQVRFLWRGSKAEVAGSYGPSCSLPRSSAPSELLLDAGAVPGGPKRCIGQSKQKYTWLQGQALGLRVLEGRKRVLDQAREGERSQPWVGAVGGGSSPTRGHCVSCGHRKELALLTRLMWQEAGQRGRADGHEMRGRGTCTGSLGLISGRSDSPWKGGKQGMTTR